MTKFLPSLDKVAPPKYKIGIPIGNNVIASEKKSAHVVSYEFIEFGDNQFDFGQKCFTAEDAYAYFSFMNWLCTDNFESIFSLAGRDWHFHITDYFKSKKFRETVNKRLRLEKDFLVEQVPEFYHFGLNTTDEATTKAHQSTSPRIFFFLAGNSVIYMLFCDMYHELEEFGKSD